MNLKLLKTYFFNKNPVYNLGLCRIFFYGLALEELWSKSYNVESFYYYQWLPKELWSPVGVFNFYPKDMMFSFIEVYMLLNLLCLFLFFAMIGFLTRISAFMSFVLALLFLGYPNNFGTVFDSDCLFLVVLFVLIFSNMGATLSLDNLLRKKKNLSERDKKINFFWDLWTIKLITTLTCLFYFTSGVQKLRFSGLDWFLSDHMAISFIHMGHPIGLFLSQFLTLSKFLAFIGFLIQFLAFLPIIYSRITTLFLVLFYLFHIVIDLTLGAHFNTHFLVLLFLFPWGQLFPQLCGNFNGGGDIFGLFLQRFILMRPQIFRWSSIIFYLRHSRESGNLPKVTLTPCGNIYELFNKLKVKMKSLIIVTMIFFVSVFVITMSVYAPYTLRHMYPFSTTTMYAWIDKEPLKRKVVFVVDRDGRKRRVKRAEIWPLAYDKLFSKIKAIEREGGEKKQIKDILEKIQQFQPLFNKGVYTLEFIKKITLEHCFWRTTKNYVLQPYQPDYCKVIVEKDFL